MNLEQQHKQAIKNLGYAELVFEHYLNSINDAKLKALFANVKAAKAHSNRLIIKICSKQKTEIKP